MGLNKGTRTPNNFILCSTSAHSLLQVSFSKMVRFLWRQCRGVRPDKAAAATATATATALPEQHPAASRSAKVGAAATSLRKSSSVRTTTASSLKLQVSEPSIEHIRNTTVMFWASRVLTSMVEMDLFTELSACPRGLKHAQIVDLLFLHEDLRPDVLDTLVSLKILVRTGHGASARYTNSNEANVFLVKHRHETYIGDTLEACGNTLYSQFIQYNESLLSAKVQCPTVTQVLMHRRKVEERLQSFVDQSGLSPKAILDAGFGFVCARVLHAAVELGLYETLHAWVATKATTRRSMTAVQINKVIQMQCPLSHTVDFLESAVQFDLLSVKIGPDKQRYYFNTTETAFFLVPSNKMHYFGSLVGMFSARLYPFWMDLPVALTTGLRQNEAIRRKLFEDLYYRAPAAVFDLFMGGMVGLSNEPRYKFRQVFDFTPYRTLVDVGGGAGHLACAAAACYPHLSCITTDLAPVGRIAKQTIAQRGLGDRVQFVASDFYKEDIPSADVISMCIVLHDNSLSDKKQLIRKAFAALSDKGVFVIIDSMIDNDRSSNTYALTMSINMLIEFGVDGGFDFTPNDVTSWCKEAGFARVDIHPLGASHSMALAYKN
jgi:cyclopropane fatty-acyl-phospholipid synthase-like methyltransferase